MNIKKGFVIQEVGGQWVAVATGAAAAEFSGIVKLNDTAAIAWRGIEEGLSRDQIVARVVESYDVDEPRAAPGHERSGGAAPPAPADVDAFLQTLVKAGIASE